MKNILFFIIIFLALNSYSQELFHTEKKLIIYKTYSDFINKSGEDFGFIKMYGNAMFGGFAFDLVKDNKEIKVKVNQYWGFSIGEYFFRMYNSKKIPICIIKNQFDLFFYADGYLYFGIAIWDKDIGVTEENTDGYFYSQDLTSKVYEITDLSKIKNPSPELSTLIECINKGKKRYGDQAKLNSYTKCLLN
jgi:hypothetical protein